MPQNPPNVPANRDSSLRSADRRKAAVNAPPLRGTIPARSLECRQFGVALIFQVGLCFHTARAGMASSRNHFDDANAFQDLLERPRCFRWASAPSCEPSPACRHYAGLHRWELSTRGSSCATTPSSFSGPFQRIRAARASSPAPPARASPRPERARYRAQENRSSFWDNSICFTHLSPLLNTEHAPNFLLTAD